MFAFVCVLLKPINCTGCFEACRQDVTQWYRARLRSIPVKGWVVFVFSFFWFLFVGFFVVVFLFKNNNL